MNALVLGAGGFLGLNVVDVLAEAGVAVRCGRRARSNVLPLRQRRAELAAADLDAPAELAAAMAGCSVVVHAAGYYPRLSLDHRGALATAIAQMQRVLDAAAAAGVPRLIYVSSTATVAAAPSGPADESHVFSRPPGLGIYHDVKWAMEDLALRETRLEVVVACPGACLGPWDLRVGTSALLVATARGLDPPHPDGVINLVDVRDVALATWRLAGLPAPPRRVILAAGNHRLHALLEDLAGRYGQRRPSPPLSFDDAVALADREEARAALFGGRPAIAREIVDLVVHGVPVATGLARTVLGMRWRPLSDTLAAYDDWARRLRILPPPVLEKQP